MSKEDEIRDLLMAEVPKSEPVAETPEPSSSPDEPVEPVEAQDGVQETEEASPEADAETQEVEPSEIVTISSLAADLEIDPKELYGMRIPVDGHGPLSIGELKDIAQAKLEKAETDETLKQEIAEREAELVRKEADIAAQAENIAPQELIKAEAELARTYAEFSSVDWVRLEASNPGEAALKRQKLMEQYQIATYNRDQVAQRIESTRSEIEKQREQAQQQAMVSAVKQMQSRIPEWRDETVYMREREHMINSYVDKGGVEAEFRAIAGPSVIEALRNGWLRDQKIAEVAPSVKPPKVLKASTVRESGRGKAQAEKRFFEQAAKSKDQRVKTEATRKLIFGR